MNVLVSLWLPILLCAVVVFVLSSLIHMVIKWHASDYRGLSNEDAVRDAIRAGNPPPGQYVVPWCKDMKEMGSEAMVRKYNEGPVGVFTLSPNGPVKMGKSLGLWFVLNIVVAVAAVYLAGRVFGLDPSHARGAGKLAGAATFLAYGFGSISDSVWMGRPWSITFKFLVDSALYGIGSGLVVWWLWPK